MAIIEGGVRDILNSQTTLQDERLEKACKRCFASHKDGQYTGVCSKRAGGCGCVLRWKTKQDKEPCPMKIWANDWINIDRLELINKDNNFQK